MDRILFYWGLVCFIAACNINSKESLNSRKKDSAINIQLDTNFLRQKDMSALDIFLQNYADSINNANPNKLPLFLNNPQFDYQNVGIWAPAHHPLPLRKLIIDKLIDCTSLKKILDSKSTSFRTRPVKENDINVEFINFSFFELAEKKYKEFNCP